jgi:putative SOS response-associated peptidase YedK
MCGRFTLTTPAQRIEEAFGLFAGLDPAFAPRYNIAPTQSVLAIRRTDAGKEYVALRWGLVPFWADDLKIGSRLINARADGIATKPAFRAALKRRRCLVVADGFYEWRIAEDGTKRPFHIRFGDRRPFAFAGLWERWDKGDKPVESCTIVTTEANDFMRPLHERMPVILDPKDHARWLDPSEEPAGAVELLRPSADLGLEMTAVSPKVNNARFEGPACLEPADPS